MANQTLEEANIREVKRTANTDMNLLHKIRLTIRPESRTARAASACGITHALTSGPEVHATRLELLKRIARFYTSRLQSFEASPGYRS